MDRQVRWRTIQFITGTGLHAAPIGKQEMVRGAGSLMQIPDILHKEKITRVLVVTTAGTIRRGTLELLYARLHAEGISVTTYADVKPDPDVECVEAAVNAYHEGDCQAVIAVGGGSAMDCAKVAAARVARPRMSVHKMVGTMKIRKKLPLLIAVPTTSGTGSEVTAAAVVTENIDGSHIKHAITDTVLVPKYAILDASLTLELSPEITADTGMDALTHAVEAYTNLFASDMVNRKAVEAVQKICVNLPIAYEDGRNLHAREQMLIGSYYAGVAFTNNFVGYVHALAHAVGALYGISHGRANAIILPVVMKEYGESVEKKLAALWDALVHTGSLDLVKVDGSQVDATDAYRCFQFISLIQRMNEDMGIPDHIEQLREEDFPEIIARAMKEGNPSYPVPQIWNEEKFMRVLGRLLPDKTLHDEPSDQEATSSDREEVIA